MGVSDKELVAVGPWPAGVDNLNRETSLARSDDGKRVVALREAVNVDVDRQGFVTRRRGYGQELSGARVHSLWAGGRFPYMLYADGDTQLACATGGTTIQVRDGLAARAISYAITGDRVYCSNGQQAWCVHANLDARPWAVESPTGQPACQPSTDGGLDAGDYQLAITYLDARGEESGTGQAVSVAVPADGGIMLPDIPQPSAASVVRVRVYVSGANGDVLYQARDVPVGQLSALVGAGNRGRPLVTQFLSPLPPGHIVRAGAGRLWVASGRALRWSEALRYGLTHATKNVRSIGEHVNLMEYVGDGGDAPGLFVADDKRTYWLGGADPAAMSLRIAYSYGAVPGTGLTVPGNLFGLDTTVLVAYWLSRNGVACLGLPGGVVVPMRDAQIVAPMADRGASLLREVNGVRSVVTTLSGAYPQAVAVGDRASARVYRNNIEI